MKRTLSTLLLGLALAASAVAQEQTASAVTRPVVHFKDGKVLTGTAVRLSGSNILVTVPIGNAGSSTMSYPLSTVAAIDFPKPPGLTAAEQSLAMGRPAVALAEIGPVVDQQAAMEGIPGNWWARAAIVRVKALTAIGRFSEADDAISLLQKTADADDIRDARLQIALAWAAKGDAVKAGKIIDDAIANGTRPSTLATAWVGKGQLSLAAKDYDTALISFLRVPVFYAAEGAEMPPALFGSAEAYVGLGDKEKAREAFQAVISQYPNSAEAAAAKTSLSKLGSK
jgi:tetratricopeptide (TPR) repeat protein